MQPIESSPTRLFLLIDTEQRGPEGLYGLDAELRGAAMACPPHVEFNRISAG